MKTSKSWNGEKPKDENENEADYCDNESEMKEQYLEYSSHGTHTVDNDILYIELMKRIGMVEDEIEEGPFQTV